MSLNPSEFIPTPYTPSGDASYTPVQGNYKTLQPFRYWCQKVLPLVYDDSLSYYELLCKVVDYLNKTMEDVDTLHTDVDNLHTAYENLQGDMNAKYHDMTNWMNASYAALVDFVNTYFANLNVQEEINNKLDVMASDGTLTTLLLPYLPDVVAVDIDSMVTSGEFASIVSPFVQPAVNTKVNDMISDGSFKAITDPKVVEATDSWLDRNLSDPANPPLDASFTLANAAAQAKAVGDYASLARANISSGDLNDYKTNGWHMIAGLATSLDISNLPENDAGQRILLCFTQGTGTLTDFVHQLCYNYANNHMFERYYGGGSWSNWKRVNQDTIYSYTKGYIDSNEDLNDYISEGSYSILSNRTLSNAPDNYADSYSLLVIYPAVSGASAGQVNQLYYNYTKNTVHQRMKAVNSNTWSNWVLINHDTTYQYSKGYVENNTDLNTLTDEGNYTILSNRTLLNAPDNYASSNSELVVYAGGAVSTAQIVQIYYNYDKNTVHQRAKGVSSATWTNWKLINHDTVYQYTKGYIADNTDLNDITEEGNYTILSNRTLTNAPSNYSSSNASLVVYPAGSVSTSQITQLYYNFEQNTLHQRVKPVNNNNWTDWKLINYNAFAFNSILSTGDLNNLINNGWYLIGGAATSEDILHMPETTTGIRMVISFGENNAPNNTNLRHQFFYNYASKHIFYRCYVGGAGGSWQNWIKLNDNFSIKGVISTGDLNNLFENGWYLIGGAATSSNISHLPEDTTGQRLLLCFGQSDVMSDTDFRHQLYYNYVTNNMYERFYAGGSWHEWKRLNNNYVPCGFYYTGISYNSDILPVPNEGTKIRLLTYNVAHYNHDTANYISDEQLIAIKRLLLDAKADFIGIQEDREYIDSDNTKNTMERIYKPIYPYRYSTFINSVFSKLPAETSGELQYSVSGRYIRYCTYTVNTNKTLLVCCTHCSVNEAEREAQYEELCKWLNGDVQISGVSVPAYDYFIVMGDFNHLNSHSREALINLTTTYNFQLLNGGYLGWYKTVQYQSVNISETADNIITSANVNISDIHPYYDLFQQLYSDHVPIMAELVLL